MVKPIPEKSREDSGIVRHIDQKSNTPFWSRQIARDKADVHKNAKNRTTLVFTSGLTGAFDLLHSFFYKDIVFPAQAECSYFSADVRLKLSL